MSYVIYKEGTISRRSGDPLDAGDWPDLPPARVSVAGAPVAVAPALEWRPVPGFPGYQMSAYAQLRSFHRRGRPTRDPRPIEPSFMTPWPNGNGRPSVKLKHASGRMLPRTVEALFAMVFPELAGGNAGGKPTDTEAA